MQSTGFSCPSRSIRVCSGSARWLWPAAVMTAFLMRKEAPGWAGRRLAQKTIVAPRGMRLRLARERVARDGGFEEIARWPTHPEQLLLIQFQVDDGLFAGIEGTEGL